MGNTKDIIRLREGADEALRRAHWIARESREVGQGAVDDFAATREKRMAAVRGGATRRLAVKERMVMAEKTSTPTRCCACLHRQAVAMVGTARVCGPCKAELFG